MKEIKIKSTLTAEDYEKITMFGAFGKSKLLPIVLCFSIPLALLQIFEVINTGRVHNGFAYYGSIIMIGVMIASYIMVRSSIKSFIRRDKVLLNKKRRFILGETGMVSIQEDGKKVEHEYSKFMNVYEIKGQFIMYLDKLTAIVLTKRDMSSEEILAVRGILKNAMGNKYIMRGVK